jgi:hypothetical protein
MEVPAQLVIAAGARFSRQLTRKDNSYLHTHRCRAWREVEGGARMGHTGDEPPVARG